jgi:hypothetical protein
MSIRQLENKLEVVKAQIRPYAIYVDEHFMNVLELNMGNIEECTYLDVLNTIEKLNNDMYASDPFVNIMEQKCVHLRTILNVGVRTLTQLIHHAEILKGASCAKSDRGKSLWKELFEALVQYTMICPETYSKEAKCTKKERIDIVNDIMINQMYQYVPLNFEEVPKRNVVPLTTHNLKRRGTRNVHPNERRADSVVSFHSDISDNMSYHPSTLSSVYNPTLIKPRKKKQSSYAGTHNESFITDREVSDYMHRRDTQDSVVSGNVAARTTVDGKLRIRMPGK